MSTMVNLTQWCAGLRRCNECMSCLGNECTDVEPLTSAKKKTQPYANEPRPRIGNEHDVMDTVLVRVICLGGKFYFCSTSSTETTSDSPLEEHARLSRPHGISAHLATSSHMKFRCVDQQQCNEKASRRRQQRCCPRMAFLLDGIFPTRPSER